MVTPVQLSEGRTNQLQVALAEAVRGEVRFDSATRAIYATDSSNYRMPPIGVVFPLDHDDVVAAVKAAAEAGVPILGRGSGTSLAGQCCNTAIVLDFSRHMNRILSIDAEAGRAVVQPGVVLDDLRREAERHGLTFGPDPATHAWCTLGGMIGNNSCGSHALFAGKTVDNVERLRIVLADGESFEVGSYDEVALAEILAAGGKKGEILGRLRELGARYADLVAERYPDIPRRVSGFNLDELVPGRDLHVARSLVGTESTCAITTEATLRLIPSPRQRRLVILGYPDVFEAAAAVPDLLEQPLLALEGVDQTLIDQMKARHLNAEAVPLLPEGRGWLFAELGADQPEEADRLTDAFVAALPEGVTHRRFDTPAEQARMWPVRESGLGATAIRQDGHHNYEGWEDAAVPPARLAEYLRAITDLWAEFGYSGAWYGHFGQGCVHTRNNFDLSSAEGLARYRAYVERAADIAVSLGGSLSGEHGDGQSRGELLERMFGPELVGAFREMKAIWDPENRMNPGKVVDPYPLDANIRYLGLSEPVGLRPSKFSFAEDDQSLLHAAFRCVGVGRCRRDDAGTMCPSYRATRDEMHSTRGRAKLLTEMFQGDVTPATWRNEDVREALDLCLSCKACSSDCPTHVDMATYKAEFFSHYYKGRLRPRVMYALASVPWASRLATRVPRLANFALRSPGISVLVRKAGGVTTARRSPRYEHQSLRRSVPPSTRRGAEDTTVVVWPDSFTDAFRAGPGRDLIAVLEGQGERVAVPEAWACCGRTLYDAGMLDTAKRTLGHLLDVLQPWIERDIPVVVPEPSCLAAFRDELPGLLGKTDPRAQRLAALACSPSEFVLAKGWLGGGGAPSPGEPGRRAVLHPHCHQRAQVGATSDRKVLEGLGYQVQVLDAGCCGLAGSFGFDAEHEPVSRRIGEGHWLPRVRSALAEAEGATLVVDGFSCVTQLEHLGADLVDRVEALPTLLRRHLASGRP
jgi:FAD/FMN-containing dehydrogenase/Fe-S oxidoreductase